MFFKKSQPLNNFSTINNKRKSDKVTFNQIKHDIYQQLDDRNLPTQLVGVYYTGNSQPQLIGDFEIGLDIKTDQCLQLYTDGYDYLLKTDYNHYLLLTIDGKAKGSIDTQKLLAENKLTPEDLLNESKLFKEIVNILN